MRADMEVVLTQFYSNYEHFSAGKYCHIVYSSRVQKRSYVCLPARNEGIAFYEKMPMTRAWSSNTDEKGNHEK